MNNKERFISNLKFGDVDRVLNLEACIWHQTNERWKKEGMPQGTLKESEDVIPMLWEGSEYFKLDGIKYTKFITHLPYPWQEERIVYQDARTVIYIDNMGIKRRALLEGTIRGMRTSMDQFLEYPVKDTKTFRQVKKKYETNIL